MDDMLGRAGKVSPIAAGDRLIDQQLRKRERADAQAAALEKMSARWIGKPDHSVSPQKRIR